MSTLFGLPENVEDFQYMAEATRGTFSTGTTAVFAGQSPRLTFTSDLGSYLNYVAGTRDASEALRGIQTLGLGVTFGTVVAATLTFLKRGVNLADGIQTTFSGCLRETVGGTARYLKLKNCLIGSGGFGVVGSGPLQATVALVGNLEAYDNSAPTNWVFASTATGAYTGASSGLSTPVTVRNVTDGQDYTPSIRSWAVGFNNGIFPIPQVGLTSFADFIPTQRGIAVTLSVNKKDLNLWGTHKDGDDVNLYIAISTPGITFTATGGLLDPVDMSFMSDAPNFEVWTHRSLVGSLATS